VQLEVLLGGHQKCSTEGNLGQVGGHDLGSDHEVEHGGNFGEEDGRQNEAALGTEDQEEEEPLAASFDPIFFNQGLELGLQGFNEVWLLLALLGEEE